VPLGWELSSEDSKMPKMKTKRAAAKRFKATGGGRIRRSTAGKQHRMRGKPANRLRKLKKNSMVDPRDEGRIRRLLPYEL
jgi:large subunit ribosomal protein L35